MSNNTTNIANVCEIEKDNYITSMIIIFVPYALFKFNSFTVILSSEYFHWYENWYEKKPKKKTLTCGLDSG